MAIGGRAVRGNVSTFKVLYEDRSAVIPDYAYVNETMRGAEDIIAVPPVGVGIVVHHVVLCPLHLFTRLRDIADHQVRVAVFLVPALVSPAAIRNVLLRVALTTGLRVHHVRFSPIRPPMAKVILLQHVLGVELRSHVRPQGHRRNAMISSVLIYQIEGEAA